MKANGVDGSHCGVWDYLGYGAVEVSWERMISRPWPLEKLPVAIAAGR